MCVSKTWVKGVEKWKVTFRLERKHCVCVKDMGKGSGKVEGDVQTGEETLCVCQRHGNIKGWKSGR